jgi:hypothetical protein
MSGLVQFVVNIIAVLAAGGIFFLSIDKVAPDEFFARIAKIAIGALLLIALVVTVAAAFGLGGGAVAVSPLGIVYFAIAVIVAVVVLYVINLVVDWIGTQMGAGPYVSAIKYILGAIVLIGLLIAAADLLFGQRFAMMKGADTSPFPASRQMAWAFPAGRARYLSDVRA